MKNYAVRLSTVALTALIAFAAVAPAQAVPTLVCGSGVCTQSGNIGSQKTDFVDTFGSFQLFNLAGYSLTDVKLTFSANTLISGTVQNSGSTFATFSLKNVSDTTSITTDGSTPTSVAALVQDLVYVAPTVKYTNLAAGATANYPLVGTNAYPNAVLSVTTDLGTEGFTGAGNFTLGATTLSGFTVLGGGGNITTTLNQFESAGVQIEYDYSASTVPEPATWALMLTGFALVGFGMRRRTASFAA